MKNKSSDLAISLTAPGINFVVSFIPNSALEEG